MSHILQQNDSQGIPRTDKHALGYFSLYAGIAAELESSARVLEVGVFRGASLHLWKRLFPEGLIAGVDNLQDAHISPENKVTWPEGTHAIIGNQNSPDMAAAAAQISPEGWDLIVDDASHKPSLSRETYRLLWPQVKRGGWYALEDWFVGVNDNDSYPHYEGDGMLQFARSFTDDVGRLDSSIAELRVIRGLLLARKKLPEGNKRGVAAVTS